MKISTNRLTQIIRTHLPKKLNKNAKIGIGVSTLVLILLVSAVGFSGNGISADPMQEASKARLALEAPTYYSIQVDNKKIVTLASQEEAAAVLSGVTEHYRTEGAELTSFSYAEAVEIVENVEENPEILSVDEAVTLIVTGTKEPKTHTVAEGDNFWDVSVKSGMTVDELIAANPQANPDALKIGMQLNLYEKKPYLHLRLTEQLAAIEKIEYPVTYESTSTLFKGELKVKVAGTYGQKQTLKEIVNENGVIVSSVELESEIIAEPKEQIMLKGTKSLSTLVGTGAFTSPMGYLEISSGYGSRGSGRHTGVDLCNPIGTPIYVVDDGVVTHASYQGTYGNLIKVSHGKGIETWYAHCDKILVNIGDVVRKGDKIGTVGVTGRTTGAHLHLEVRVYGVPKNPMNYL